VADIEPTGPADAQQRGQSHPNTSGKMRSGSDQRPRGRFNGNRPFQQQPRAPQGNRNLDSNGPNVKIRGNAYQIFERYVALAREAAIGDDRVAAENLYQHAEHYFRLSKENRDGGQQGSPPRPATPADVEMTPGGAASSNAEATPEPRWEGNNTGPADTFTR
jgi:hypothetical protein